MISAGTSPGSASRQILRSFVVTLALGIGLVAGLWGCVAFSLRALPVVAAIDAATPAAEARSIAIRQSAAAAGRSVIVFGLLSALAAAAAVGIGTARRLRDREALAERIARLPGGRGDDASRLPRGGPPTTEMLLRRVAEAQHNVGQRIAALDAERRRGFHVLGHMTDGVLAVNADRRVLLLNSAAIDLLGLSGPSWVGRRLVDVVRVPQIIAATDAVLGGDGSQEVAFQLPGDADRFLHVQAIELPADGSPGALVTIRDETKLRQLERMRREFIANVSHELKTPLSAVKGYAETLQLGAKEDAETCTHFLTQIHLQTERLERLINDMLQLARAQSGSDHLKITSVPLASVLGESIAAYEPLARARGIELRFSRSSLPAAVLADREALLTIANNLIGNAIRYTPSGGHVDVTFRKEGDFWAIIIADDGVGIPEPDQERVFERFYRVEKARDASLGGTGLGLSIVKNLVQALGGKVRLQSRPGEGSTFEALLRSSEVKEARGSADGNR